jgi:hypothetical protein
MIDIWLIVLGGFGVILLLLILVTLVLYLLQGKDKKAMFVHKDVYARVLSLKESIEGQDELSIQELSSLYESISEVAAHKDTLIKKTGAALKSMDSKLDQYQQTIARLEQENSALRNNDKAMDRSKQLKLLISIVEEIDKFSSNTKEEYLSYLRGTVIAVLNGLDCFEYTQEFMDQELLKYYSIKTTSPTQEYRVSQPGFYVPRPEGHTVIKYAVLDAKGV